MVVPRKGRLGVAELPCRLVNPDLFFAEAPADVEVAKAICVDCPIREACLAGALQRREPWGVWGGSCSWPVPSWRTSGREVVRASTRSLSRLLPAAKDEAAA